MDKPKILIEQQTLLVGGGHNISLKGEKKDVVVMIAYVMKEVPEVAEAIINAAALYLREDPKHRKTFAHISGIN